jgi:hypothetical protein
LISAADKKKHGGMAQRAARHGASDRTRAASRHLHRFHALSHSRSTAPRPTSTLYCVRAATVARQPERPQPVESPYGYTAAPHKPPIHRAAALRHEHAASSAACVASIQTGVHGSRLPLHRCEYSVHSIVTATRLSTLRLHGTAAAARFGGFRLPDRLACSGAAAAVRFGGWSIGISDEFVWHDGFDVAWRFGGGPSPQTILHSSLNGRCCTSRCCTSRCCIGARQNGPSRPLNESSVWYMRVCIGRHGSLNICILY